MAARRMVLDPKPKNPKEFDRVYREEHVPYAGSRLAGAVGVEARRLVGLSFAPPPYHLISDVIFPDIGALKACAASKDGQEALQHAASISSGGADDRSSGGRLLERIDVVLCA